LIVGEKLRVLDRSVMVDLPPSAVDQAKDSGRPDVEVRARSRTSIGWRADEDFRTRTLQVEGNLPLNGPTLFGPRVLTPIVADFLARNRDVTVTLTLNDSFVDPAESGADLTIRIGESPGMASYAAFCFSS
jgi:DNA-binding transcriptional LysR family regulator